ncbi:MAG: phosphate ABC transporter permease subunit PstC [Fimbriimonadaceae bacterium]|nr:phosphate ABC transporter permease subunit PstC [Fimbriimonadaceae bacterium]
MAKAFAGGSGKRVGGGKAVRNPLPIKSFGERVVWLFCLLCALVSIITTFGILYVLLKESVHFFQQVSFFDYLTGTNWSPLIKPYSFGVLPLVVGTLQITVGAAVIALPLGLLSAIFLSEYASPKLRRRLKPILELLAGVPTVVYGYFALNFVTPALQGVFPSVKVFNAASGAIVVGIMILPLVSSLCEDALSAVPRSLRDGAYALGSTKLEVTMKIAVPAALSGVMAAFVLAISRAVGETMAVTLAAGQSPNMTLNPGESIQTMTAYIVQVSKGDTPSGSTAYYTIFAVGITLFAITSLLNMLAVKFVKKYRIVYA